MLKADVSGSLEALQDEIAKLPQDEIVVNVIHAAAGGINESDVMLAAASDAIIIGFNVRPLVDARRRRRARGRRDPHLLGDLQGHRGPAGRDGGHARARGGRGDARPGRGQGAVPRLARGHDRRLPGHRRQDHPRRRGAPGARGHGRLDRADRLAAALQGQRRRRSRRGSSAASCSTATRTSRSATCSSSSRPSRSSRRWSSGVGRGGRPWAARLSGQVEGVRPSRVKRLSGTTRLSRSPSAPTAVADPAPYPLPIVSSDPRPTLRP